MVTNPMPAAKLTEADRAQVKATFIATQGDAVATAKQHGLTRFHVSTLAMRGNWPFRPRKSQQQAADAQAQAAAIVVRANPSAVNSVNRSAADAIAATLAELGTSTRLSLATASAKAAKSFEADEPDAIRADAQNLRHIVSASAVLHNWESGSGKVSVNIYGTEKAADVIEIEPD